MLPRAKSHTPVLVLGPVGVAVEVVHAVPARVLEQFDEKERAFHVFAAEAKVLIEAAGLLRVEVDVKELSRLERLTPRHERSPIPPSCRARLRG